jgi:hypothetical protein
VHGCYLTLVWMNVRSILTRADDAAGQTLPRAEASVHGPRDLPSSDSAHAEQGGRVHDGRCRLDLSGNDIATSILAIGVAKEGPKLVADLVRDLAGPAFKAAGEGLAAPIQYWRDKRILQGKKVLEETARQLEASGDAVRQVPVRMLVPLLEKASLEEEPELCRVWAALLANMARNPEGVLPAFVSILGELSPTEVRLLASWATGSAEVKLLANAHHTNRESLDVVGDVAELRLILANLERLLLIVPSQHASSFDTHGDETFLAEHVRLTRFGARFILACSRKASSSGRRAEALPASDPPA